MRQRISKFLDALDQYDRTCPESVGVELRLDLSRIILGSLRRLNWTQKELAHEAGVKEPYVSRVLHSNVNCTFETAGKLLFALGVRARIEETPRAAALPTDVESIGSLSLWALSGDMTHGEEGYEEESYEEESSAGRARFALAEACS